MNTETHEWTSAVIDASLRGQVDLVSQLLDSGVEINLKDNEGWTALHFAAAAGYTDIVELLLARGADVNSTTIRNESCLLLAVLSGHIGLVHVLVSAGADVNLQRYDGVSPLHAASQIKYYDFVKQVLGRIAQVITTANEYGMPLASGQQDFYGFQFDDDEDNMIVMKNKNESPLLKYGLNLFKILMRAYHSAVDDSVSQYDDGIFSRLYTREFIDTLTEFLQDTQDYITDNVYSTVPLFCALLSRCCDERRLATNYETVLLSADGLDRLYFSVGTVGADANLQSSGACSPLRAASERDVDIIKLLLDNGAELEARDNDGFTPLHSAADRGHTAIVKLLLDKGADVNSLTYRNDSCLLIAARRRHKNVMGELISAGASVNLQHNDCIYLLHAAITEGFVDVAKMLLENDNQHGVILHASDELDNTLLHDAGVLHRLDIVQLLVHHGAKVNVQNREGETPLHIAIKRQHSDVIVFLLSQGSELDTRDIHGYTPLHSATDRGQTDVVKLLLDKGADVNSLTNKSESCLLRAASRGHTNVMRELIYAGADVNLRSNDGTSPLRAASQKGFVDVVKMLLENDNQHGVNVNTVGAIGNTPLHEAVGHGLDIVQLLVLHGAKLNAQNRDGRTPLHIAVQCRQSDVIMFLLSEGADVGLTDVWRNTPLHYVTCELLEHDALREYVTNVFTVKCSDLSIRNSLGVSAKKRIEACGLSDYNVQDLEYSDNNKQMYVDCQGNTPLHHAVARAYYEELGIFHCTMEVTKVVEYLVKRGADINAQNNCGHTPLHVAQGEEAVKACLQHANEHSFMITDKIGRNFWHLWFAFGTYIVNETIFNNILISGAGYDDSLRRSPLHYACMRSCVCTRFTFKYNQFMTDFVERLVNEYDIVNKQDIFGRTALHYAPFYSNWQLMDFLQELKKVDGKIKDKFGKTAGEYQIMKDELEMKVSCVQSILQKNIQGRRYAGHPTLRNIYLGCRVDYSEKLCSEPESPDCLYRRVIEGTYQPKNVFAAIQKFVTKAMKHLANEISSEDSRFACEVFPVGSAHEGTKIECCDEFDYNFVLTNLSKICQVGYSPESPPGFVLLKASTPEYDEDLFNSNGTLNTRVVKFRFEALVKQVLSTMQFCEVTGLEFIEANEFSAGKNLLTKLNSCIKLAFTQPVDGCHVMHGVSIDVVPAIQINDWWPDGARKQDLCQTGECLIVFTQPQKKHPWIGWTEPHGFISFARAESRRLRECPQVVKAAYMVVKWMCNDWSTGKHELFSSHVIKTALLWCLDDSEYSSDSDSNDEVHEDELLILVQNIVRQLLRFAAQDFVPSYFLPKCRQAVWLKEEYPKEFHTCLYQHGLTYRDIFSLDELQFCEEQLQDIRSTFICSHIMAWTTSPNTDELEFIVPSTINPLCFEQDVEQFNMGIQSVLGVCNNACRWWYQILRSAVDYSEQADDDDVG